MTMRYGIAPSEVDRMPLDLLAQYFEKISPDTLTFSDEQSLMRWLAQQNNG